LPVPEVRQLSHDLTNRLTVVTGWSELGEYNLAIESLTSCDELLTKIYAALRHKLTISPPS
jgi:sensor histidine kinase regulating citrate/malate metabolism